eukprot:TRINITY_DN2419_c0_g1_i1.p1 TRINITY_DN2419_c0_g1~~TRINITY_DN2419_c0_g1_i1.p1  ORF type:complete len:180 (+),score=46.80 TRINITY_DN2419_c0_g1_i1:154-693(+)
MMNDVSNQAAAAVAAAGTNKIKEMFTKWKEENFTNRSMRSWTVFCSKNKFSVPKVADIANRLKTNFIYFQINYVCIFGLLTLYAILTNLWFLVAIAFVGGMWSYGLNYPAQIRGRDLTQQEKSIGLAVVTLVVFWLASVSNTIFWLIGATLTTVTAHALFFSPVEEEVDFESTFGAQQV